MQRSNGFVMISLKLYLSCSAGLSRHSEFTQIYVNTGTNQAGPRARLASSREITVHVFHSKK